ncbi:MAG: TerB family tellurite resistance protein [Parvibaculales bacterium]
MFKALKNLFDKPASEDGGLIATDQLNLAMAALLVHAARLDGDFAAQEHTALKRILEKDFGLDDAATTDLMELAETADEAATDLYRWTSVINSQMVEAEKVGLIEHLWQIILADDAIDDYEASLVRRVCGLIHVPDRLAGEARKRVETAINATGQQTN